MTTLKLNKSDASSAYADALTTVKLLLKKIDTLAEADRDSVAGKINWADAETMFEVACQLHETSLFMGNAD